MLEVNWPKPMCLKLKGTACVGRELRIRGRTRERVGLGKLS